jgi:hypothetical protein
MRLLGTDGSGHVLPITSRITEWSRFYGYSILVGDDRHYGNGRAAHHAVGPSDASRDDGEGAERRARFRAATYAPRNRSGRQRISAHGWRGRLARSGRGGMPSGSRQGAPAAGAKKQKAPPTKPNSDSGDKRLKPNQRRLTALVKQRSSIMSVILTFIYRSYFRACLVQLQRAI